jgi:Sulfotransferase family
MRALVRRYVPFPVRRAVWRVRRNVPRVAQPLSLVLPRAAAPARPVLVIGCPRSGTSALLQVLLRSPELRSVHNEGHILWQPYHHPRDRGWASDALGAGDITEREREYIYMAVRLVVRDRRFVDKTPESCLRIRYLRALFPDASFVFLRRRAADNVNSLMEGWRARPRFVTYRLPEPLEGLGPLSGDRWSFVLIPGWRELRHAPLEEICARQYIVCNEAALNAREEVPSSRWLELAYEDLVDSPVETSERLFEGLGLDFGGEAREFAAALNRNLGPTALSPPRAGKWREQNREEIERILPVVAPTERRLGW